MSSYMVTATDIISELEFIQSASGLQKEYLE